MAKSTMGAVNISCPVCCAALPIPVAVTGTEVHDRRLHLTATADLAEVKAHVATHIEEAEHG